MRCFTYFHGELTKGIKTTTSKTKKRLVFLGSQGPGCGRKLVFFDRKKEDHPYITEDGLISFAYPAKRKFVMKGNGNTEDKKVEKVVLKKAYPSPTKILLRVNTSTDSTFRINGRWQEMGGWPISWVEAHGFFKGQRWCDDLITMDDMDVILITPAGGGKNDRRVVYNFKGEIGCIPEVGYKEAFEKIKENQILQEVQNSKEEISEVVETEVIEPKEVQHREDESEVIEVEKSTETTLGKALDELDTVIHEGVEEEVEKIES